MLPGSHRTIGAQTAGLASSTDQWVTQIDQVLILSVRSGSNDSIMLPMPRDCSAHVQGKEFLAFTENNHFLIKEMQNKPRRHALASLA